MKLSVKFLSLLMSALMLFGAASVQTLAAATPRATTTTATSFKASTVKLKSIKSTVNGPKLEWAKLSGAKEYYIYRKTASSSWKKIATAASSATTFVDKDIKSKVGKYIYTVKAINSKGQASKYNKTGLSIYFVKAPVLKAASLTSDNKIKLTWGQVSGATGYYVYRKTASGSWAKIATVKGATNTSYVDKSSKTNNTKYFYTVKAYKAGSSKTYTSSYNSTGLSVLFLKAATITKNTVDKNDNIIYWSAVKGATIYKIYRSENLKAPDWEYIGKTENLKYRDKGGAKKDYAYMVRPYKNSTKGSYSSTGYIIEAAVQSAGDEILKNPLAAYQKAASEIHKNGSAGYSKKTWQEIPEFTTTNSSLNSTLQSLISGFVTTEADAETKVSKKGSEDAMMRMPASNCSEDAVKSVTVTEKNSVYTITIVMKKETNVKKSNTDGINVMGNDLFYIEDIENTISSDASIKRLVKSFNNGEIVYNDYTITAKMTEDGKLIQVDHYCKTSFNGDFDLILGDLTATGTIILNSRYSDFSY